MLITPPTPFLPTTGHSYTDQSLLIDAEPTFDDSFDWPVALPETAALRVGLRGESTSLSGSVRGIGSSVYGSGHHESGGGEFLGSMKRSICDTPLKSPRRKKPKPPTPVRDDFYTRRVKDSDRRSSLGPRETGHLLATTASLSRSASRESIRSSNALRQADSSRIYKAGQHGESSGMLPSSIPLPQHCPTTSDKRPSADALGRHQLHRIGSSLSDSSSSRRESLSEKVTGFFSKLIRRESSSLGGGYLLPGVETVYVGKTAEETAAVMAGGNLLGSEKEEGLGVEISAQNAVEASEAEGCGVHPEDPSRPAQMSNLNKAAPRLRMPATLTRPAPLSLTTASRALQPKKTIDRNQASSSRHMLPHRSHPDLQSKQLPTHPRPQAAKVSAPNANPSFTARAISRLPIPGKGSTSSSQPTTVRAAERARDLASKREAFERLAREAAEEKARSLAKYSAPPVRPVLGLRKTVPVRGHTPGKASRQRAEERARFEQGLRERHEEKRQRDEELRSAREEMERAEDRADREDRVVRARVLPEMYTRRGEAVP